jgi:hypothetical protein
MPGLRRGLEAGGDFGEDQAGCRWVEGDYIALTALLFAKK